ncbi:ABC transporter substrate-binding protein [Nonomuraea sp. KC401]|uniref:ABC transporter substrate-binding protein n=1 Tax=unclassified Nonomuraea TaxID=2593643 RepID=UPI0010FD6481|nr:MULTISPECIES: ABC transporter substrate-binding protein [unclassified Nonomuraea]NBE92373.1 ABC transporter substrate-binding protein [Nonomuraea sp. K271]TLF81828.1 ABC transporter substrate-binding protein [Nonomuraea sp. KC401]
MRVVSGALTVLCATAMLSACGSDSEPEASAKSGGLTPVTFAMASPSWNAGYAVMAVVEAEGFYEEEGLKVTTNLFPSATQAAQQVAGGGADLGLMTVEPVAIGHDKDLDLAYFSSYWAKWIYSLQVPAGSGVKSIADLQGKKIGVSAVASSGATFARTAMELNGMSQNAAGLVPIGAGAQQINAIKSGQADALALWDIQYQIVKNAGVTLTPLPVKETAEAWGGGFATTRKNLEAKKDVLERFGRAVAKAFVFSKANPEAAIRDLWKLHPETRGSDPEEKALADGVKVLEVRLDGQGFDDKTLGRIDEAAFTRSLDFMASAGLIKKFPAKEIYTDEMFKAFNDFSYDDVVNQAESAG